MSSNNSAGTGTGKTQRPNRFHSPPVELPSSNAQNFFEEAKTTAAEENELRRKFGKFCTKMVNEGGEEEAFLTLEDFCRMLQYYECASAQHYEAYFHAIDRNHDDQLDFDEFFLGCCAADPSTVHILNSFTGYERSQYIFDFYDTNRSSTLEFDEFARLTADCLSLPTTNPNDEQVKRQAIEKARDLGALEESGSLLHFTCIKFKKFYEYIQNERLRGTSRLFRFYKSIIKSRGGHHGRRGGSSSGAGDKGSSSNAQANSAGSERGTTPTGGSSHAGDRGHGHADDAQAEEDPPSEREDCEWHAHLLDLDKEFDPEGQEPEVGSVVLDPERERQATAYNALLAPAPLPSVRIEPEPPSATDARTIARKVLRTLCTCNFDGLLSGAGDQFTVVTPAQLRSLCTAAVRLLEPEDMVLTGLQPPVKVFGAIHGQLLDLLSQFKWHQSPVEEGGDILYTTYVFLGDYVDRGGCSLEVLTLLLSLKVAHPHRVALLRGHHENRHLNYHLGLRAECERRLGVLEGAKVFEHVNRVFEHMSLAAVISNQILALGPGVLPPSLTRLDQLRRYKKPLVLPHMSQPRPPQTLDRLNEQVLLELFTPVPLIPKDLGVVREATPEQVKVFCAQHKLAAVVRSRQIPTKGFDFECGGRLITISSCLNYCDSARGNDAAILCITKDEGSPSLGVRPKVLTAHVAKIYRAMGGGGDNREGRVAQLSAPRWPAQVRHATPGRINASRSPPDAEGAESLGEAAALVILADRSIAPDTDVALVTYPAFGPGRPPGGSVPSGGSGLGRGGSSDMQMLSAAGSEDWALLGASAHSRPGGPERRSLGLRRSSGAAAKPIVTQVLRGDDSETGGPTPKGHALERRQASSGRAGSGTGGGSASTSAAGGPTGAPLTAKAGSGVVEGGAHRRSGLSPTEGTRLSLNSTGSAGGGQGMAQVAGTTSSRDPKASSNSAGGGGRSTPQSGGVSAGDRRNGNGKAKEATTTSQPLRGSSRPLGVAPSPKASTPAGGARGARRTSSDASRGEALGSGAPSSPRRASSTSTPPDNDERGEDDGSLTSVEALSRVLQDSRHLVASGLPPAPAPFLQAPRASEQPLVLHLCRLWVDAGLNDKEWVQALHMFEAELYDQPRQKKDGSTDAEPSEGRWTLETFSMWLLKRGRRLRECSQWFRAFDFDQDEMIGVADFLQGLVAAGSPRPASPSTAGGLCTALALFRLLDLEKRQSIDVRDMEGILGDAQVSLGGDLSLQQVAQRATDFDFFRGLLLPRLSGAAAFRLRVFGSPSAE